MWQSHAAEGKEKVSALTGHSGPSVGRADGENEALGALIADAPDLRSELLRGELLAAAIQQNGIGRSAAGLTIQPIKERRLGLEELGVAGNVPGNALEIVSEQASP